MKIFENIINYFKRIFVKQKKLNSGSFEENELIKNENPFMYSIKKDFNENTNKQNILDEINKNPALIDTLPYQRLVQLNSLYEEKINDLKIKISQIS